MAGRGPRFSSPSGRVEGRGARGKGRGLGGTGRGRCTGGEPLRTFEPRLEATESPKYMRPPAVRQGPSTTGMSAS